MPTKVFIVFYQRSLARVSIYAKGIFLYWLINRFESEEVCFWESVLGSYMHPVMLF